MKSPIPWFVGMFIGWLVEGVGLFAMDGSAATVVAAVGGVLQAGFLVLALRTLAVS